MSGYSSRLMFNESPTPTPNEVFQFIARHMTPTLVDAICNSESSIFSHQPERDCDIMWHLIKHAPENIRNDCWGAYYDHLT